MWEAHIFWLLCATFRMTSLNHIYWSQTCRSKCKITSFIFCFWILICVSLHSGLFSSLRPLNISNAHSLIHISLCIKHAYAENGKFLHLISCTDSVTCRRHQCEKWHLLHDSMFIISLFFIPLPSSLSSSAKVNII